ncbi:acyl-phosphate glycerol 3-phosphate acyltransferase [Candidatus Omnitrophus magneticus]|uniref:Glycerol-3-phosphate acyltransferase n=1 Tax=Candidatus Omnitrophus magneticus TaxID=1609969 RepID=A0A0F0CLY8_9BACT|nr:acyl-phosphate glycerol 3-phosphate acyltransferase [Candidatus Omnitrophus magneticus]
MLISGIIISMILSYLLGSIPTGYIFAKTLKNIDIREHGSGNVGATNVFRTIGKIPGIIVFVIDFLKGFLSVIIIPLVIVKIFSIHVAYEYNGIFLVLCGASAIIGHIWTVFLNFKGGKGVATTAGVIGGIAPLIFISSFLVWIIVFYLWKYVSLASILAGISLPIFSVIYGADFYFVLFSGVFSIVGILSHRANIKRLLSGVENKISK